MRSKLLTPYWMPVWLFLAAIFIGAPLLRLPACLVHPEQGFAWLDAIFTATSAVCVTGLVVVDTGTFFTPVGQGVILVLIQLGGLGIMTYTSLVFYLFGRRISLADRTAVSQTLLSDPSFNLVRFVLRVVGICLSVELCGALLLLAQDPSGFHPWSALFHAISAFCNAGFSLYADSLSHWRADWGVNLVFMLLIVLGGLGFAVLIELGAVGRSLMRGGPRFVRLGPHLFTWRTRVVLSTSLWLILGGGVAIFLAEWAGGGEGPWNELLLSALFQSVSCRTAGFNTVEIGHLTNVTLMLMLMLMFVGGSPGSTAGGIKTTTARALLGYVVSKLKGGRQVIIGNAALSRSTRAKAISLAVFAMLLSLGATMALQISEGGDISHDLARGLFLETLFEAVSAFGTVGLSTGLTSVLTDAGKAVICVLMFIGRLGPIWLLSALQSWQTEPRYRIPENDLPVG
ncbi:MAG: TrkH family potassium uptake protein [Desulfovibrionaceae bacterium]